MLSTGHEGRARFAWAASLRPKTNVFGESTRVEKKEAGPRMTGGSHAMGNIWRRAQDNTLVLGAQVHSSFANEHAY